MILFIFQVVKRARLWQKKPLTHDEIMCKRLSELNNNRRFNWEVIRRKKIINAIC